MDSPEPAHGAKWDRLAQRYRTLAVKRAGELHGNATQEGKGSRVMADYWHQGGRWAEELCEALDLPSVLATRREDPYPDDELISPTITLGPLHDFQVDVYTKLRDLLSGGLGRTALLSLPTGAGKTRVAVEALCDHLAAQHHAAHDQRDPLRADGWAGAARQAQRRHGHLPRARRAGRRPA